MSTVQITKDKAGNEAVIDLADVSAMAFSAFGDLTLIFSGGGTFVMGEKWADRKALFEAFTAHKTQPVVAVVKPAEHVPVTATAHIAPAVAQVEPVKTAVVVIPAAKAAAVEKKL